MVSVRENLTQVEGVIVRREPHPTRPDYDDVVLEVERTEPVADLPDLLHIASGDELHVAVRPELLGEAPPGRRVRLRAARTSRCDVMAEPHPEPGHFAVS
jgi:hypothetical protein